MTTASPGGSGARLPALFAIVFLSSGAALLVYILSGISLLWTLVAALAVFGALAVLIWRRSDPARRAHLRRRVAAGAVAGVIATAAYDASRFALIKLTGITFWPYDIFGIFGQGLIGRGASSWWVDLAGFGYHLTNGVGFAIAFTILFGARGILYGIGWALFLEAAMLTFYPGWLDIRAITEFVQVSMVGHLVYGTVLGFLARRLLVQGPFRERAEVAGT